MAAKPGGVTDHRPALCRWLAGVLGVESVTLTDWRAPEGGGWSNETVLFSARAAPDGLERHLVLRLTPAKPSMFRDYDLSREYACLSVLSRTPWPPVPDVLRGDWTGQILGRPFYVMDRIEGLVPADQKPSFLQAGWLFDATPQDQRAFYTDAIRAIAGVHQYGPATAGLEGLRRAVPGANGLEREIVWLRDVFQWGAGPRGQPLIEDAFARALAHIPEPLDEVLLWGDARPANMVVRDFRIRALLDWELATFGPRELDLFWFLEMNAMRGRGSSLPGFLNEAETIAAYETIAGAAIRHHDYFRYVSALKVAVLMLRNLLVTVAAGQLPADHPVLTDNIATRRLANLRNTLD